MTAILTRTDRRKSWVLLEQSASTGNFNEVGEAFQCPHCQMLFEVHRGSGKDRGFCMLCSRPTCGKRSCDPCRPWEMRMEQMEGSLSIAAAIHRTRGL